MVNFEQYEVWFVTGSQHLYGPETLDQVNANSREIAAALKLKGRVHATEARFLRAHTQRRIKFTLPGPMTIVDTVADQFYGDRVAMAEWMRPSRRNLSSSKLCTPKLRRLMPAAR